MFKDYSLDWINPVYPLAIYITTLIAINFFLMQVFSLASQATKGRVTDTSELLSYIYQLIMIIESLGLPWWGRQ